MRIYEENSKNIKDNKFIGEFIISLDENEKEIKDWLSFNFTCYCNC